MAFWESFGFIFDPLLQLGPFWAIFVISLGLSIIIVIIYKLMTNQEEMKALKAKTKEYQKEMKKYKDDPKKVMKIQKEAMSVNGKYMMKSMKPTLVTFLPILIIFGWLAGNLAYESLNVNETFYLELEFKEAMVEEVSLILPDGIIVLNGINQTISNNKISWELKAQKRGIFPLSFKYSDQLYTQKVIVTDKLGEYEEVEQRIKDGTPLRKIKTILEPVRPFGDFSFFGWKPNWLWSYIILSMIFSISLRKLLKIH